MGNRMKRTLSSLALAAVVAGGLSLPQQAEAKFVFPYNHPDLEWYSITTEHFVVHYPVSKKEDSKHWLTGEWTARKMAKIAEESWQPMCEEFNYYLKEKVHIVLLNQGDELQGFTIPSWDWIEISSNPGGTFYRSRGRMEWISDVFVHEFAHVVSLKANGTHSEGAQGVLVGGLYSDGVADTDVGAEFFIFDGDSVFWTEGGAEYWSDNTGYNWWTPSRDQNIRMTVLDDRLLRYEEWHTRSGKGGLGHWNDSERYYQQGYSFGMYLRQRFGDETYAAFALEYGRGWRPAWETVIEDVLGIDAETLYWDWRNYVTERYSAQRDRIRARGEVAGREMLNVNGPREWHYTDPEARDAWYDTKNKLQAERRREWERDSALEATGRYQWEPRVSPDGEYFGVLNYGAVSVQKLDEDQIWAFTGKPPTDPARNEESRNLSTSFPWADFEHGWDFVPGTDQIVMTGREDNHPRPLEWTGIRLETDGYNWKQLYLWQMEPLREDKVGNRTVETRERKRFLGTSKTESEWLAIPNTQRGADPSVSPDGQKIAYLEFTDGVLNLVTINLDGTDKKHLTSFDDGTWMQTPDWSPDGSQIVFAIFKNFQQNLYTINADGTGLKAIMQDQWEELDAHWNPDGKIYFSADPDGVFNIFSYDPATGDFLQLTNVVSGAFTPQITPDGNLVYSHYTAHGWKVYGLPQAEFYNLPANHLFNTDYDEALAEQMLAFREDLSGFEAVTTKYKPHRSIIAPSAVPIFRLQNGSRSSWQLQAGIQLFAQDFVEKYGGVLYTLLGEDNLWLGQAFYQGWYPNFYALGYRQEIKYEAGYLLDEDENPETTDDQEVYEIKNQQYVNIASLAVNYPWNGNFGTDVYGSYLEYGFKGSSDPSFQSYLKEVEVGLNLGFSNNAFFSRSANPYFGRTVDLGYTHAWTDIVYEPYGGVSVDDGQELDNYEYNKAELRWVENLAVPNFWGIPILRKAQERQHVLQLDARLGYVDRNVDGQDEFRAGGQHPYFWGNGTLRPNTQFAGFPGFSLSGETMAIFGAAYRFPVARHVRRKVGPIFLHGVYAQFGGTAGNLWSYRPPEDPDEYYRSRFGERIAYDSDAVKREIPFVDYAYKNGNYMLYDASAELRVQSVMFHGATWDSFARLAYGFNEIRGYGDVDGDDIFDTSDSAIGDELSNETEKPGLRVYLGFGTGW